MTKSGADKQAFDLLVQAGKENGLTNKGKLLKNSVQKMLLIQQAGYEKITLLGAKNKKKSVKEYMTITKQLSPEKVFMFSTRLKCVRSKVRKHFYLHIKNIMDQLS